MSLLRRLLVGAVLVALVAGAIAVTNAFQLADRLSSAFFALQGWIPPALSFDQFLIAAGILCLLVAALTVAAMLASAAWLTALQQRQLGRVMAAAREAAALREEQQRRYDQLVSLGRQLAEQLDKRMLVQRMVEAASRLLSVPQGNALVSCWLLHFETDTLRFERGQYCDETLFAKTALQPGEAPFGRAAATQQPLIMPAHDDDALRLVRPEKRGQLGAATRAFLIPLVIEHTTIGLLLAYCHPDAVAQYERDRAFYEAVWAELALALGIAVQGEVAILDRLTGVHNREYFMKRLVQEIERANRFRVPLSLLMLDIDNFKQVNDTLGHPQGDAVLKIISKILKKSIRAVDLVGRYGGEEFIVLLPETGLGDDAAASGGATLAAERLRRDIEEEFQGLQKPLNLTVSVGVACRRYPEDRELDYRELIRLADEQLLRAKTTGKNKVCLVAPERAREAS